MSRRVEREFEPCLATGSSCGRQQCRATSGTALKYAVDHWQSSDSCLLQAKPCRTKGPAYTAALSVHGNSTSWCQRHPRQRELLRQHFSKLGNRPSTPHTHPQAWPEFLLADAALSTPVFEPPVMPVHDTRLRLGGVMRFKTKRISHRFLHRIPWMDPAYVGEKAARRGP